MPGSFRYPYHIADLEASLFGEPAPPKAKIDAAIALLEDNARALEDYLDNLASGALPPFDFPGPLSIAASDLWSPPPGSNPTITVITWTLASTSTAGSVQVGLFRDTVLVDTIIIPAGTAVLPVTLPAPVSLTGGVDTFAAHILSTGTGAAGLLGQPG